MDGQVAAVRFTRDGGIVDFEVDGLEVECQSLDPAGGSDTRTVEVTIARADIAPDGNVDHTDTETGAALTPTLSGSFTAEGAFAGALFLTGEQNGSVCGGEFTFIAHPG